MEPRFQHDCEKCTFLGQYTNPKNGHEVDLYHCDQGGFGMPTVIARYGDDGPDYTSGIPLAPHVPTLAEAKRRAEEKGLNCIWACHKHTNPQE